MYEKHNWVNGEVITEDKLNHMEDGISTGGGIYTYEEVPLFDGEVTTVSDEGTPLVGANITLQGELPKTDIHVTFNGQDYTLPYGNGATGEYWGEVGEIVVEGLTVNVPVFTNYPLFIAISRGGYMVATPEAGTYSLKINETVEKLTVNDALKENMVVTLSEDADTDNKFILDKTYSEIISALKKGKHIDFMLGEEDYYEQFHLLYATDERVVLVRISFSENSPVLTRINFSYTTEDGYPTTEDPLG